MSINRVNISGNLTRDPELRATAGGTQVSYVSRRFAPKHIHAACGGSCWGSAPGPGALRARSNDMSLSYLNLNAGASVRGRLRTEGEELSMGHGLANGGAVSDGDLKEECASYENGTWEGCLVNPGSERHGFPKIPAES